MPYLAIITALLQALQAVGKLLADRQLIKAGEAKATSAALDAALKEIARAQAVRSAVRNHVSRDPSRLRDDDGFKRAD